MIDLTPGEYAGPVILDVPVTLRGLNRKTVLWRRAGPVIWVRAPDVTIENVLIERTIADGPLIVHDRGCAPKGVNSIAMDALVSLGELLPGVTLTLPVEIETTGPTIIDPAGVYGAHVTPSVIEEPGLHTIWITIDGQAIGRGEMILGEVALREGDATRYLWLSGSVTESPVAIVKPISLSTRNVRLYPAPGGSALGPILRGIKVDEPGDKVHILHDAGGHFLYLSAEAPVRLNDSPVAPWSRLPLHEKDTLTVGSTTFTVAAADTPPILVEPRLLGFADFAEDFPEALSINVRNGRTAWKGQVISTVPWAEPTPVGDVRIPPSRTSAWSIQPSSAALNLPDGTHNGSALVIGTNLAIGVDLALTVRRADVALRVEPLDAGAAEWGWPLERLVTLSIDNLGRGIWTGTVTSTVPWLQVVPDMPLTCGPWARIDVSFRVTPVWETTPVGLLHVRDAIAVSGLNEPVAARLNVTPAQGHLNPLAETIAFDSVERDAPLPDTPLTVRNDGAAPWTGTLHAANGWVKFKPEMIAVAPGATVEIEVLLLDVPLEIALNTPILIDEIQFEGEGDPVPPVGVQMTLVELPPFVLANPVSFPPFVRGDPPSEGTLHLHNMGPGRWRGEITTTLPWLTVPEKVFLCEPNDAIDILITLNGSALEAVRAGFSRWEGALYITGVREPVAASVEIDIREAVSELHIDTPTLNFGQLDGTGVGTDTLRLVNASPSAWKGKVELRVPWIAGPRTFDLEVPGMNVAEVTVTTDESARWLRPGARIDERAIVITGRDQTLAIRAMLALEEWSLVLTITPEQLDLPDEAPHSVTIRNDGHKTWSLAICPAPWLTVTPTEIRLEGGAQAVIAIQRTQTDPRRDARAVIITAPGREYAIEVSSQ
ncbi:MAG TPA: hypothetical protein VMT34_18255 [Aggregatilineales bacterium]|nr:hypothetical protein [Aggregatilineales bacterium]